MSRLRKWRRLGLAEDYRVDICLSVFNHENSVQRCIESILSQTHQNLFITVVDDHSSDRSWSIIRELEAEFPRRIKAKRTARRVGSATTARRECGFQPIGEFWGLIDGDDWWMDNCKIRNQILFIHDSKEAVGCSGTTLQVGIDGKLMSEIRPANWRWSYLDYLRGVGGLYVHKSSIIWKNVFRGEENFLPTIYKESWPMSGDWPLTLACLADSGRKLYHLNSLVSQYNWTEQGVYSKLSPEEVAHRNSALEETLRSLVPLRYRLQLALLKAFRRSGCSDRSRRNCDA